MSTSDKETKIKKDTKKVTLKVEPEPEPELEDDDCLNASNDSSKIDLDEAPETVELPCPFSEE
jgi:hypothetical protein